MRARVMQHQSAHSGPSGPPDKSPLFSVILPTHNRADMLRRAVNSVLAQTFNNFELIIVDDGSNDDTPAYLGGLDDVRIRIIRNEISVGAAAARNKAVNIASGRYVSFLDDDDEYLPSFLELTAGIMEGASPEVGFCWSGIMNVRDDTNGENKIGEGIWDPGAHAGQDRARLFLLRRQIGTNCGLTVRRSCFGKIGLFDEVLRAAEDTDFLIRLSQEYDYAVVREILVKVHRHNRGNLTVYGPHMAAAYSRILEKNTETLGRDTGAWREMHYKTGWLHYHAGDKASGRSYLLKALRRSPFHIKIWAMLLVLECPGKAGN
ncbi:MAG TPA: glycosyltransferase family 2 protein, partial [Thermodesulfovibrionales bacterium]|nr:glycosyltransferase family 2 protein [Thermodesulfovibrionales bacterium]